MAAPRQPPLCKFAVRNCEKWRDRCDCRFRQISQFCPPQSCQFRTIPYGGCGELLQDMEKAKGHRFTGSTPAAEPVPTIPEMGLTHKQSSKFQQLAEGLAQSQMCHA